LHPPSDDYLPVISGVAVLALLAQDGRGQLSVWAKGRLSGLAPTARALTEISLKYQSAVQAITKGGLP
jgi:hypothetical protein